MRDRKAVMRTQPYSSRIVFGLSDHQYPWWSAAQRATWVGSVRVLFVERRFVGPLAARRADKWATA